MSSSVRRRAKEISSLPTYTEEEAEEPYNRRIIRPKQAVSPVLYSVFLICFGLIIFYTASYFNDRMPSPNQNKQNGFVAERAIRDLEGLVNIGPKVTGSDENEVLAIEYIMKIVSNIKETAFHKLDVDLQLVSGSFSIGAIGLHYNNLQNIIVRLGPANKTSLLINCHFDTVPTSPGASDDGLNCAVMLEVLRVISSSKNSLEYGIIFLFNGAEENPLLASHGFITQHKWAKEIKAFINLESCGAGGREILFQTGPNCTWVVDAYAEAVKHPSGNVIGEELFQSGIIPSDTDFRIFRDFGHIPGLDFAHCRDGYVYHTAKDDLVSIVDLPGVIQHTGDNVLSMVLTFTGNKSKLSTLHFVPNQNSVYFDILGIIFFSYSTSTAVLINSVAIFLSAICFLLVWFPTRKMKDFVDLAIRTLSLLITVALSMFYNLLLAVILDTYTASLSWFTNSFVLVPIYVLPTVLLMSLSSSLTDLFLLKKKIQFTSENTLLQFLPTQTFWAIILLVLTFFKIRSAFLLLPFVLLPSVVFILLSLFYNKRNPLTIRVIYFISSLFSSLCVTYYGIQGLKLFLPITGRAGTTINPDLPIAGFVTLITFCSCSYACSFIAKVNKIERWAKYLLILHVGSIFVLVFSKISFPFSPYTPQRILITDLTRNSTIPNESLLFIDFWERRGASVLPKIASLPKVKAFCTNEVPHCGLPWASAKIFMKSAEVDRWLPSTPHGLNNLTSLQVTSDNVSLDNVRTISLKMFGPDHMTLIIHTKYSMISWSIDDLPPTPVQTTSTGTSYAIRHVHGLKTPSWDVILKFQLNDDTDKSKKDYIHIDCIGHHMHGAMSKNLKSFIATLPSWVHVTPSLATLKAYKF
ncbi:endoplasmic reticulum metallopeptidase 1-like isoform X2 [Rhodnius prolixus]|uniref:endoplasmic reticulum metallopeptidase 1-like isoform X2 n=1 Tax=Rhodnius prolixus TaxID=13249 RepID=UPI003D187EBB